MAKASAEKLQDTGPDEKERVASVSESSWQVRQSRLCQKVKEQSPQSKAPDREVRQSQGEREPHIGEKEGDGVESGLHNKGRGVTRSGRASKESLPRRKHGRDNGRNISPGESAESWFYSKSGQT